VSEAPERERLRWQCRRGLLELDALFMPFLEHGYAELDAAGRAAFQRLLGEQDPVLSDWFMGRAEPPDAELAALAQHIVTVVSEAGAADRNT